MKIGRVYVFAEGRYIRKEGGNCTANQARQIIRELAFIVSRDGLEGSKTAGEVTMVWLWKPLSYAD